MADCGELMIGVDSIEPKIPPLVMVKVPPVISSIESLPSRAFTANLTTSFSTSSKLIDSAFLITGTMSPLGAETAIDTSAKSL